MRIPELKNYHIIPNPCLSRLDYWERMTNGPWMITEAWKAPEIRSWAKSACKGKFVISRFNAAFEFEEDATLFILSQYYK